MSENMMQAGDEKLGKLLRATRPVAELPPGFQDNVWRRIEDAEVPVKSGEAITWLDALVALLLRPRFAYATVAALMLGGIVLGAFNGAQTARHDAEARYLASVAPNSLR